MTAAHLTSFRDANGQPVQPYYAAFMIERGHTVPHSVPNYEFMEWIQARWNEFEDATGRPHDHHRRRGYAGDFLEWLDARSLNHIARNHVEAA